MASALHRGVGIAADPAVARTLLEATCAQSPGACLMRAKVAPTDSDANGWPDKA